MIIVTILMILLLLIIIMIVMTQIIDLEDSVRNLTPVSVNKTALRRKKHH